MAQTKEGAIKVAAQRAGITVPEYVSFISRGLKKCTICKEWKSINDFSTDRTRSDGRAARCNICSTTLWRRKSMLGNKRAAEREGDRSQARHAINRDVRQGLRPNPNSLFCSLCGHKGKDRRHEYHHTCGYGKEHFYDVLPLCSKCHHAKERNNGQ